MCAAAAAVCALCVVQGIPVEGLKFDPDLVIRGLIMDKDRGNLIKVDRFG